MTKVARKATMALLAAVTAVVPGPANANDEPIAPTHQREMTIVLHVANYRALPRLVLDTAIAHVEQVYQAIGVRTVWDESEETIRSTQDGRLHLTVILLSREMAGKKILAEGLLDNVLGQAYLGSGRAYIFCDRIAMRPGPKLFAILLGAVIAHEVGHLLLREKSHSRSGIMRAETDAQHAIQRQSFDQAEASSIRNVLLEVTAGATRR